jgi:putative MATE family efflux protein
MATLETRGDRDWTQGPILRNVFGLAWPSVLSMILLTAFSITDAFFLGYLGTVPLAAAISAIFVVWMIFSVVQIITTGTTAIVARHVGEGRHVDAAQAASHSLWWGVGLAALLTVVGHYIAPPVFGLMNTSPEVTHEGVRFLRTMFYGSVFLLLKEVFGAVFQATGDTRRPLIVNTIAVTLNIILDPLLIFGQFGFPRLETMGAALATVISYAAASVLYAAYIRAGRLRIPMTLAVPRRPDFGLLKRLVKIGLPLSIGDIIFCTVYLFLNEIVAGYGAFAIAALGIGNRLESINYMISHGFGVAAATLVGQNLGAGHPDRAAKSAWYTTAIVVVWTGLCGLAFVLFRDELGSVFLQDAAARGALNDYLILLGSTQLFMGVEIVLYFAFAGAGHTLPPALISVPGAVLRIPIAWWMGETLGLGLAGVWWAITLTMVLKGVALAVMFRMNRWQSQKVEH